MLRPSKRALKLAAPVSGVLLVAALLGPASPAVAESGVPCVGELNCTDTFEVTGEVEFWTVPNGVVEIQLLVSAGQGGGNLGGSQGGTGGSAAGWLTVSSGETLAILVGDEGHSNWEDEPRHSYGGGGVGVDNSAGGGGGSFVYIRDLAGVWQPLLIAGGGGGALDVGAAVYSGGPGGFSDNNADAEGVTDYHAQGGTSSGEGNAGGTFAIFDGSTLTPGFGQDGDGLSGAGGGGYFGGAAQESHAGGGGSGFASARVIDPSGAPNYGPGQIQISYSNFTLSETSLSVQASDPVVGSPVGLEGTVTRYNMSGGGGQLLFTAYLDGAVVYSESVDVTIDSGIGPWTGVASTSFVPEAAGEYTFTLLFESVSPFELHDSTAADVVLQIGDAPPTPPSDAPDELAETGAPAGIALGIVGAGLLSGGAILVLLRCRARS